MTLDLDATDDPLHGEQEQRFFHGYYNGYCYLPLYIFSGRHLLAALLRPANIDASADALEHVQRIVSCLREVWPTVKILLRADSGFAREELMGWCEQHQVDLSVRPGPKLPTSGRHRPRDGSGPGPLQPATAARPTLH